MTKPTPHTPSRRPRMARPALLTLLAALPAAAALAATVQVTVLNAEGKPAADVAVLVQPTAAWSQQALPEPQQILQQYTRFVPFVSVVPVGGSVRFANRDRFDHHVRSQPGGPLGNVPPAKQFEFRMAAMLGTRVASSPDLKLDVPGTITIGCHIHGSMRGHILVSSTPWYGVTDDKGVATIANVPDGQAEVRLWHPDQLSDQAHAPVQANGTQKLELKLNFNPRRRPPPAAMPDNYGS